MQEHFVIEHRKRHRYLCSKFAYVSKDQVLCWSAIDASDVRVFRTKEDAIAFLDKKWMKYGDKVNEWKPVEITKAKWFKQYFVSNSVFKEFIRKK